MRLETFFEKFDLFADAPDVVAKMRELVLELAVRGQLSERQAVDHADPTWQTFIDEFDNQIYGSNLKPTPPFEIPKKWRWVCVDDVADACGQKKPNELFSYIDVTSIDNQRGQIKAELEVLSPENAPSRARKLVQRGTVIYATVRPYLKNIAVVDRDFTPPAIVSTAFAILHPRPFVDGRFLFHWLRSKSFEEEVAERMKGVAYPAINDGEFRSCPIPLPPLAEQKRIVAKVDELMALCDRLEAQQQEREQQGSALARASLARFAEAPTPANLDWLFHSAFSVAPAELRKSILTLALQGKLVPQDPNDEPAQKLIARLTPRLGAKGTRRPRRETVPVPVAEVEMLLPSGWASTTLETLADVNWGNTSLTKSSYTESGFPAYSATGPDGLIDHAELSGPGIVLSAIGARSGKCFLASGEWTAIKNTITILPHDPIDTDWLFLVTNIEDAWKRRGGAQPFIALKDALTFGVRVPPLAEQRRIVAKVDELMAWVDALETQLATARTTAANLLAAAVAELTNGNEAHAAAEV